MSERRNFTRVLFRGEAELRCDGKVIRGDLNNLSLRGMLVTSPDPCPLGKQVAVQIELTGATSEVSIRITGQVVRLQEGEIAIEFTGMDLDSFILLKNVIVYNSESEEKILEEFNHYMKLRSQNES